MEITAQWIQDALQTSSLSSSELEASFREINTDSRSIQNNDLFLALTGENFDGHRFVDQAIEAGAKAIIISKDTECSFDKALLDQVVVFEVDDTLDAYRTLASAWRDQFDIPICAVAGSVGKTTTKELLTAIIQGKFKNVLSTQKSENGFVGIPKTLLRLNKDTQAAVIEIGIDEIGAMQKHVDLVRPTIGVVTAITEEHLEKLKNLDQVTYEESSMLTWIYNTRGKVVLNIDEPRLIGKRGMVLDSKLNRGGLAYTLNEPASSDVIHGDISKDGSSIEVSGGPYKKDNYELPLPGEHNALNLLAALTCSAHFEVTPKQAQKGLSLFEAPFGRTEVRKLEDGITILGDYYNSSPSAVRAALILLNQLWHQNQHEKKWACLGDMLELGEDEEILHRRLSFSISAQEVDFVLLYGDRMKWLEKELKKLPEYKSRVKHFKTHEEMANYLKKNSSKKDIALIKGSRGMKMETVIQLLESEN